MKMTNCGYVVILILLVSFFRESYSVSYTNFDAFFKNITGGKNINLRPVLDHKSKIYIYMSFQLTYIQEFNEVEGKLSLSGYFDISWVDQTIAWNSTENGIEQFSLLEHIIWKPSFIIGNFFDDAKLINKDDTVMRVKNDGNVRWTPGDNYEVVCNADVSRYPFDTQICKLHILPWGYTNEEIEVVSVYEDVLLWWYNPQKTWKFIESSTSVAKNEDFQSLEFSMTLKRNPMFFVLNLLLPICVMIILNIFVFLIPPESGERVGYAVTVLLAIAVFLNISSGNLPATSSPRISSISLLLFADVVISAVIVLMVILSLRYHHRDDNYPVSTFMRGFVNVSRGLRCKVCCCRRKQGKYNKDDIKWTDVGKEVDIVCGLSITAVICIVNALYITDVTVGLPGLD